MHLIAAGDQSHEARHALVTDVLLGRRVQALRPPSVSPPTIRAGYFGRRVRSEARARYRAPPCVSTKRFNDSKTPRPPSR